MLNGGALLFTKMADGTSQSWIVFANKMINYHRAMDVSIDSFEESGITKVYKGVSEMHIDVKVVVKRNLQYMFQQVQSRKTTHPNLTFGVHITQHGQDGLLCAATSKDLQVTGKQTAFM